MGEILNATSNLSYLYLGLSLMQSAEVSIEAQLVARAMGQLELRDDFSDDWGGSH